MLQLGKSLTRSGEFLANTDFKTCHVKIPTVIKKKLKIFSAPLTDIYKKIKLFPTIWLDGCNKYALP